MLKPEEIQAHEAFAAPGEGKQIRARDKWYHAIELAPGIYSPGKTRRPVALTRELLRHVDVESGGAEGAGARCLDIGLQEGMVTILLERRGGSEVVGYDRAFAEGRLDLVQRALDTKFELIGDMKLQDLPQALRKRDTDPFDVVVFSGVLYHMIDPLGGLAVVRSLVRDGGICLVETAVAFADTVAMHFNALGHFTPGGGVRKEKAAGEPQGMMPGSLSCFWYITPRCLDYVLRFLRFEPLDMVYLDVNDGADGSMAEGRVAVACRAVTESPHAPEDEWLANDRHPGLSEFVDWRHVASELPEVGYANAREGLVRGPAGTVDLQASIEATEPFPVTGDQARLAIDTKY
jgi:SAM-dependent methyltransferase